jgi:hypothetical protein
VGLCALRIEDKVPRIEEGGNVAEVRVIDRDSPKETKTGPTNKPVRIDYENVPRYWIFRGAGGLIWVQAVGQKEARAAAGNVNPGFMLHYATAGEAYRVVDRLSASGAKPVVNLSALEALAAKDPEPDSGAKRAWLALRGGGK